MDGPSLFQHLSKDLSTHQGFLSPGFQAIAVARLGAIRMSSLHPIIRRPLSLLHRAAETAIRALWGIELPHTVELGEGVRIDHQNGIVVHGNSRIGAGTVIRQNVTIGASGIRDGWDGAPEIGTNVSIGSGAAILGPIRVGHNATIGANAVVTRDVPHNAIVVGSNRIVGANVPPHWEQSQRSEQDCVVDPRWQHAMGKGDM